MPTMTRVFKTGIFKLTYGRKFRKECSDLAAEVNEVMTKDSWVREMSMDVPENDKKIYHKTMRFQKYFTL